MKCKSVLQSLIKYKSLLNMLLITAIIFIAFISCSSVNENNSAQNKTSQIIEKAPLANYVNAGMYKVGKDIPQGEYLIYGEKEFSYYQVTKDSTGSLESIVSNDNFSGTRYITVTDGQYIEIRTSKMLPSTAAQPQQPVDGKYPSGMYKAGKDIKPGEYKVVSIGDNAYLEVRKNSMGSIDAILTNDNFKGEKYITIPQNNYIVLNDCYLTVK
jgi:hypothetical protein